MTFKRRYPVETLDLARAVAIHDGFESGRTNDFKSEIEWGYEKQTLTFLSETNVEVTNQQGTALPTVSDARLASEKHMPEILRNWNGSESPATIMSNACLYGPVSGTRWRGSHPDVDDDISIEVWTLPMETSLAKELIVEISFKRKAYDEQAKGRREALMKLLEIHGWLLSKDVLKTQLIFERFHPPDC